MVFSSTGEIVDGEAQRVVQNEAVSQSRRDRLLIQDRRIDQR